MPPRRRSNPLALAVLACLLEEPTHPYEVARTLRQRAKHESVRLNYGALYKVVANLERDGLIRARETVREGRRPERTIYEVTADGEHEFVDWLSDLLAVPVKEYLDFEAALSFLPGVTPEAAISLLRERCDALEERLKVLRTTSLEVDIPRLFVLEGEYQHALLEAELHWVRGLIADLEAGRVSGMDIWRGFHRPDEASSSDGEVVAEDR